jgi:hypothetical protein
MSNTKITSAVIKDANILTAAIADAAVTSAKLSNALSTKIDGIEASADVTDATNVTAAGALMDSEVTNLAEVKAFASSDYATAAQGTTADAALPKSGGAMTGAITTNSTIDGRDVATDGTKLDGIEASATADQTGAQIKTAYEAETNAFTDAQFTKLGGIEASADVTDATNVTAAGALMDSELTSIASVKALNQGVATTDSPTFVGLNASGDLTLDVAGDIILDADGADVILKDGGTGFLEIDKDGDNARLKNPIADGDIKIQGIDGASTITALSLDMSLAGYATFNDGVKADGVELTNAGGAAGGTTPKLYSASSGTLGISANGAERIVIDGPNGRTKIVHDLWCNANVGIGTASPQALIDLTVPQAKTVTSGATFAQLGKTNESSGYASLQCEVKGGSSAADRKWLFQTIEQGVANAGSIVLQPDGGNVGIGTTTSSKVEINHGKQTGALGLGTATMLRLGQATGAPAVGNICQMSMGYGNVYANIAIAAIRTSAAAYNTDDLVFATKSGTTDSAPTERLRLDSSGALILNNSGGDAQMYFGGTSGTSRMYLARSGSDSLLFNISNGNLRFGTNGVERLRIAPNARQTLNGSATATGHGNFVGEVGSSYKAIMFEHTVGGGEVGSIVTTSSSTSYGVGSDYRLKENVVPMTGSIDRVKALKPSRFNFIVDADKTVDGFLAHEAQEVVPECATGTKDAMKDEEYEVTAAVEEVRDEDDNITTEAVEAVMGTRSVPDYQGIDQAKLVPLLTAALQEAITQIESLTDRIAALEE